MAGAGAGAKNKSFRLRNTGLKEPSQKIFDPGLFSEAAYSLLVDYYKYLHIADQQKYSHIVN